MSRPRTVRLTGAVLAFLVLGGSVAGCTTSPGEANTLASPVPSGSIDPNDVPADDTDYSKDAGTNPKEYEYEDEEAPAESIVATLCNLNQSFFKGLRAERSGVPTVDDNLRTSLVGLSDLIAEWDTLRVHYPDAVKDIDTANAIYNDWDRAILDSDNGDTAAAARMMTNADKRIGSLPKSSGADC